MKPRIGLTLIAVVASGCNLFSGRCTYELRSYQGTGAASTGGASAATAQVGLSEQRGSLVRQSFTWQVTGSLKGHVTAASFKDTSNPSMVLLNLPLLDANRDPILEGVADSREGASLAGFHDILVAEHGVIELQTDSPSTPTVTIPITTTNASDWVRPYCS